MINEILWPVAALGGLGLVLGLGLAIASKFLSVEIDPKIETIRALLPGANCGGCGYPGCDGFAAALAEGRANVAQCSALPHDNLVQIAGLLGMDAKSGEKMVARVLCQGDSENCRSKYKYSGISDCRAAAAIAGGPSSCPFGCVGLLACAKACPFGAIYLSDKGIAAIDEDKCTGCGKCAAACPKNGIVIMPKKNNVYISCRTTYKGKSVTSICKAGCIGCSLCAKKCPQGAITMQDNLPIIDYDKCTGCGVCAAVCPRDIIINNAPADKTAVIKAEDCIGCGICKKECPTGAISGELKAVPTVDPDKCVACGICIEKCPKDAITLCDR
ncbi:MAG: 4Fe-4S binding protein [Eubacteriales bacterium]|nr:4Fe-4S binding protein [Eubacteriales bacterium]